MKKQQCEAPSNEYGSTGSVMDEQLDFEFFTCPPHTTTRMLGGTMKVTCGENGVYLQARIALSNDFDAISQSLMDHKEVSLLFFSHPISTVLLSGSSGSDC